MRALEGDGGKIAQRRVAAPRIVEALDKVDGRHARLSVGSQGGLNRSSQHFDEGGCDGHSEATFGSMRKAAVAVTRSPPGGKAKRAAAVLEVHRDGH